MDCSNLGIVTIVGVHHGWFRGLRPYPLRTGSMLLSLSQSGALVLWSLGEGEPTEQQQSVLLQQPRGEKGGDCSWVRGMDSTRSGSLVLCVSRKEAQVYFAHMG